MADAQLFVNINNRDNILQKKTLNRMFDIGIVILICSRSFTSCYLSIDCSCCHRDNVYAEITLLNR